MDVNATNASKRVLHRLVVVPYPDANHSLWVRPPDSQFREARWVVRDHPHVTVVQRGILVVKESYSHQNDQQWCAYFSSVRASPV